MVVTCWILLIFFGLIGFGFTNKLFFKGGINEFETLILFVSIFIVSISAGILFGGLFDIVNIS